MRGTELIAGCMALVVGLALRCASIYSDFFAGEEDCDIYRSYRHLLSPAKLADAAALECLARRSLSWAGRTGGGDLCSAFNNAAFAFYPVQQVYNAHLRSVDAKVLRAGASAVNLLLQLVMVGLLSRVYKGGSCTSSSSSAINTYASSLAWKVYWLGFVSVSIVNHSCLSVFESLLVVAVVSLDGNATAMKLLLQLAVFMVLICTYDSTYVILYCALLASDASRSGGGAINGYHKSAITVAALSLAAHDQFFLSGARCAAVAQALWPLLQQSRSTYDPSLGVFWYLEALQIRSFDRYFFVLRTALPWLYIVPLYFRVRGMRRGGAVLVNVALLLRCFVGAGASLYSLQCVLLLVGARDFFVVTQMRFLPVIAVGMVVPLCCSPLTLHLWVGVGSGNANYLFFCGLASWLSFGLFIVEYFLASLKTYDVDTA